MSDDPVGRYGRIDRELRALEKGIRSGALPHRDGRKPETWAESGLYVPELHGDVPPEGPSPFAQSELYDEWSRVVYQRGGYETDTTADEDDDGGATGPVNASPPSAQPRTGEEAAELAWKLYAEKYGRPHDPAAIERAAEELVNSGVVRPGMGIEALVDAVAEHVGAEPLQQQQPARTRRTRQVDDDDDGRTEGIFGGMESGGKPSRGGPAKESPSEFVDDLKQFQLKHGLY